MSKKVSILCRLLARKRSRHVWQTAFVILLLVAASSSAPAEVASPTTPVQVLILPITMYAADDQPFLRAGLIEMLASRLRQNSGVQVSIFGDSKVTVSSASTARELAKNRNADFVLFGSFTQFGDGVSFDLQCLATSATAMARAGDASRGVFAKASSFKDFIRDLDDLAARVSVFVLPPGASVASNSSVGGSAAAGDLRELERRVEKIERELHALQKDVQTRAAPASAQSAN